MDFSQALHKGGEIFFSPLQFFRTRNRPDGIWQSQQRMRILIKDSFPRSLSSVVPGLEKKVKFHTAPSYSNLECQPKNKL